MLQVCVLCYDVTLPDPDNAGDAEHLIANSDVEDFRAKRAADSSKE